MNIEKMTRLMESDDIEMINCSNALPINATNKSGNMTRGSETYPDIIEVLLKEEVTSTQWSRSSAHNMGGLYFPAVNDMYFYTSQNVHVRNSDGRSSYREVTYGLYYIRTSSTLSESDRYIYVTNTYNLHYNPLTAIRSAVSRNEYSQMNLVSGNPLHPSEDRRGLRICRRTTRNIPEESRRYGWDREGMYRVLDESTMRDHLRNRVYPRMTSHLTGDHTNMVTNALTTVSAWRKDTTIDDPSTISNNTMREYTWLLKSELQSEVSRYLSDRRGNMGSVDINELSRTTEVVLNGNNDKKHESMLVKIKAGPANLGNQTLAARLINTSESPGNLEQQLRDILEVPFQHGYTHILDDFTPTVLLTDKVGIDYYDEEEFPIRYNLELLTGVASPITFIRTTEEAGKSPMGTTLSDMCQFDDGVYKVNLDRAIELHLDERKLSLEKGTYTICVDEAANTDFLWYLAVIDNELSDVTLKEITTRLTIGLEEVSGPESIGYAGRNISVGGESADNIRLSNRFARGNVYFDEIDD